LKTSCSSQIIFGIMLANKLHASLASAQASNTPLPPLSRAAPCVQQQQQRRPRVSPLRAASTDVEVKEKDASKKAKKSKKDEEGPHPQPTSREASAGDEIGNAYGNEYGEFGPGAPGYVHRQQARTRT